jgi:hypothetical protein
VRPVHPKWSAPPAPAPATTHHRLSSFQLRQLNAVTLYALVTVCTKHIAYRQEANDT